MAESTDKPDHDGAYRTLFTLPTLVQQFIETFAPPSIVKILLFDQMTPMPTTFLTETLTRRTTDCIWQIPTNDFNLSRDGHGDRVGTAQGDRL